MIEVTTMAAQGDVLFRRVKKLPKGLKEVDEKSTRKVVAHSETGHHHAIDAAGVRMFQPEGDPLTCYLVLESVEHADVVHYRPWDTHETLRLLGERGGGGVFQVRRQREYTPEGWRRVED
jgi:hypothetical protein